MNNANLCKQVCSIFILLFAFYSAQAQDRIYTNRGEIIKAKVKEISPTQVKYIAFDNPDGPLYIVYPSRVDSIVYPNGKVDVLVGIHNHPVQPGDLTQNIPQLNTWTFDPLGFISLSVSQSYERRLKNGKVGFRVPLYVGFIGGGIAGVGTFKPGIGVYYPYRYYYNNYTGNGNSLGSSMATGLNVKCYLFKRRIVRAFAGPEATIGYTSASTRYYNYNPYGYYTSSTTSPLTTYGTFALLGKAGISLNPVDKFNITIDGGAGVGDIFGHEKSNPSPVGFTGLWHIGLSLGTNF